MLCRRTNLLEWQAATMLIQYIRQAETLEHVLVMRQHQYSINSNVVYRIYTSTCIASHIFYFIHDIHSVVACSFVTNGAQIINVFLLNYAQCLQLIFSVFWVGFTSVLLCWQFSNETCQFYKVWHEVGYRKRLFHVTWKWAHAIYRIYV